MEYNVPSSGNLKFEKHSSVRIEKQKKIVRILDF